MTLNGLKWSRRTALGTKNTKIASVHTILLLITILETYETLVIVLSFQSSSINRHINSRHSTISQTYQHFLYHFLPNLQFLKTLMENLVPTTMTSLFPTPDLITGLTGPQKCSIYAAWQLVKKDFEMHVRNVFARFVLMFFCVHFRIKSI